MGNLDIAVNQPSGRVVIGYIHQESTGFIYNKVTEDFEAVVLADTPMADRSNFKVLLIESPVNTYRLTVDTSLWANDYYSVRIREVVNLIEYPDILAESIEVVDGIPIDTALDFRIVTAEARTLFCYNKSVSTGLYYSVSTDSMQAVDLTTATIATRSDFRVPYVEESPGTYVASLPTTLPDGTYSLGTYELVNDVEIEAGHAQTYRVADGKRISALLENKIQLSHNTGGLDALRYVTSDNIGIVGATVKVFLTSDYVQSIYTNILGTTTTAHDGRWTAPIEVSSAAAGAYTVVFNKEGSYGPDITEI